MYISSFHIDGFGILSNVTVEDLPPGISIFMGRNEAGKSTCLEFLRAMLTGYPLRNRELAEKCLPVSNAKAGGSLTLACEGEKGVLEKIRLSRRPGRNGGLSLYDESGNLLGEERLAAILSGISQEVYRKVFGFSLGELETFESLSDEGVRNALYGASFGPGLVSPAEALKILKNGKDRIFKAGGSKAPLNAAIRELEDLRKTIREKEDASASYDQLCLSRDRRKEEMALLRKQRSELEIQLRLLERKLSVWEQQIQWRQIRDRLDHLPALPESFPEEGLQRLARIRTLRDEREADLAAEKKKLDNLRKRRESLKPDPGLASQLPALRSLAERKSSYRQALSRLDGQIKSVERSRDELSDVLMRLGPDWDCARIKNTDRSLFAREDLSRHEEELHNAQLAYQAARDTLESANQEVEASEKAQATASEALARLPEPEAVLTAQERDDLRQTMGRLNESRRLEQVRQKAFAGASEAFERAIAQARITIAFDTVERVEEARKALNNIASSQEEARNLASELRDRQLELEGIKLKTGRLEENAENIRLKAEATIADAKSRPTSSRDALELRSRSLRSLRSLDSQIATAREKMQDLESRINGVPQPVRVINWTLLVVGLVLILGAGGLFLANYFWGLTEIALTDGPSLTINSWMCYLAIACGVILLTFGFPPNSAEKKRYQRELSQLQASRENAVMRMVDLDKQAHKLMEAAGIDSMDPITLDATEMLLEREKEQCIHDERSQRDAENLQRELSAIRMQLTSLQKEAHQKEKDIQQCRRKWLALMDTLRIGDYPSPESISTVFARVEACGIALGNVESANRELEELWEELHLLESSITSMPAIQQRLKDAPVPLSLEEAVDQTLDACREADIAREQRQLAQTALQTVESALESARRRQEEAARRLEAASSGLAERRAQWAEAISGFGLGENLDPQIMREALQLMDSALRAEEKLLRQQQEVARDEREIQSFESDLSAILSATGRAAQENDDFIMRLDKLLEEAEQAYSLVEEQKRLEDLIAEQESEHGAREAALESGNSQLAALLRQGEVESEDAFVQTARLVEEKGQLLQALASLESSLRVAAGKQSLEEFLATFEEEDQAGEEQKLASLEENLRELSEKEREAAAGLGNLEARVENLAISDELARLRQEEAMLLASMDRMVREWSKYALAEAILLQAKQKFEKERQPEVIRMASEIFAQITNRQWSGLRASLEDARLEALPGHGEAVAPHKLSRGAQEQAYLALRLAYIRDHSKHATPLPVIMDEILVNFDPDRAARTARAFVDLVKNVPENRLQQILYFTCQPHMVDILRGAAPDSKLYVVEDGDISAA